MTATMLAMAAVLAGDQAEALRQAQAALGHSEVLSPSNDAVRWSWPIAVDAAIALGDSAEVTRLLGWLERHPRGHVPPLLRAARLLVLARIATATDDAERSAGFDAQCRRSGRPGRPSTLPSPCSTMRSTSARRVIRRRRKSSLARPAQSRKGSAPSH